MALTTCPECHAQVSDQAPACVKCGAPLRTPRQSISFDVRNDPPPATEEPRRVWPWIVGLTFTGFVVLALIGGNSPEEKQRQRARQVIEECWKEQGRKSLSPGQQQFIAGACEKLERDYKEK